MEIWKKINEKYLVSNLGNVKNVKTNHILKPQLLGCNNSKYYAVYLYDDTIKKQVWKYIHRLVAEAFLPNSKNLPCVNHKDENKLNNFVYVNEDGTVDLEKSNLEWCTHQYNINYGNCINKMYETNLLNGKYKIDKRNMSEEEILEANKEYKRNYYKKNRSSTLTHQLVIYEVVETYLPIIECNKTEEAASYLGVPSKSVYYNIDKTIKNKKFNKKFLIKRK